MTNNMFNGATAHKWNVSQMKSEVELITPETAKEYLAHNTMNRPLSKVTVQRYAEVMRKGQWMLNGEAICFDTSGALVNGQTRLNAVIEYGGVVAFLVVRNCDTDCFKTYDSGRNRRVSDVFSIDHIPNGNSVSGIVTHYFNLKKKRTAIGGSTTVRDTYTITKADYLNEYRSTPELYQKAHSVATKCHNKLRLLKVSEIGGMYVYLTKEKDYSEEFVEAFFVMLFYGKNITNNTIFLLRERLVKSKTGTEKITGLHKQMLVIKTWNAYVKNNEYKTLRWVESTEGRLWFI